MKLKDSLVSSLNFSKAKDAELAWIDGQLDIPKSDLGVIKDEEDGSTEEGSGDKIKTPGELAQHAERLLWVYCLNTGDPVT